MSNEWLYRYVRVYQLSDPLQSATVHDEPDGFRYAVKSVAGAGGASEDWTGCLLPELHRLVMAKINFYLDYKANENIMPGGTLHGVLDEEARHLLGNSSYTESEQENLRHARVDPIIRLDDGNVCLSSSVFWLARKPLSPQQAVVVMLLIRDNYRLSLRYNHAAKWNNVIHEPVQTDPLALLNKLRARSQTRRDELVNEPVDILGKLRARSQTRRDELVNDPSDILAVDILDKLRKRSQARQDEKIGPVGAKPVTFTAVPTATPPPHPAADWRPAPVVSAYQWSSSIRPQPAPLVAVQTLAKASDAGLQAAITGRRAMPPGLVLPSDR